MRVRLLKNVIYITGTVAVTVINIAFAAVRMILVIHVAIILLR